MTDMNTSPDTLVSSTNPEVAAEPSRGPGRPRKISDAQLEKARELYEQGWSAEKIASQVWCKVKPATLLYHFGGKSPVGDGVTEVRPRGRKGVSNEQLAFLVEKYSEGHTLSAIREMSEMKRKERGKVKMFALATLSKAVQEAGIQPRRGRPAKAEAEAEQPAEQPAE